MKMADRTHASIVGDMAKPDDPATQAILEFVARHSGRAYHLFAGRSGAHPELMANDLAWWAAIRSAAEDGCRDYDLWGVPPPGAGPDHPWHGLGFFKAEFGGDEVAYAGAWEFVLSEAGSKLKKAHDLGVTVLDEPAFLELLKK